MIGDGLFRRNTAAAAVLEYAPADTNIMYNPVSANPNLAGFSQMFIAGLIINGDKYLQIKILLLIQQETGCSG
jgi:hypothetical protein